jgi:hypothetical protein
LLLWMGMLSCKGARCAVQGARCRVQQQQQQQQQSSRKLQR